MHARVYGIPNCDRVKKALSYLKQHEIDHAFHDFKLHGVSPDSLDFWFTTVEDAHMLLNKKSTTWRNLDELNKEKAATQEGLKALLLEHPNLIKRPVVELNNHVFIGQTEFEI